MIDNTDNNIKKILIIITKGEIGGAQMSVLGLARGLKQKGHDITVGFGEGDWLEQELGAADITAVRFKSLKRTHNPFANLSFIFELKKYLDQNLFDAVHINSSNALTGALGAKLSRVKPQTVFTFRGLSLLDEHYRKQKLLRFAYRLFFRFFLRNVDQPVFVCQANLDYALKHKIVKKGTCIYNGIDTTKFEFWEKEQARNQLMSVMNFKFKILNLKFLIGSIGRLDYAKNYEFLIEVFPKILAAKPDAVCLILGEGRERKKYERLIKERKLEENIILAGELPSAARYLKAFDLFVLPSRYEGLSITLIEALTASLPILTTRVGGSSELLRHSEYQLYALDNEAEFLGKIKIIMENAQLRQELGERNMEQAKQFTLEKTVEGYEKIFFTQHITHNT
jgi:glycosyltransferase involved in cell wall biosynthesis